jgi:hypothetical protein
MAISDILGFARDFNEGAPIIDKTFPLGSSQNGQTSFAGQIRFLGNTARRLASSESGSRGYFPGANVVVADYDNPFLELQVEGLGLTQATTGQFTFDYVAPNVAEGQLSVEIFDAQGRSIGSQALPRTNGTYEIPSLASPEDYTPDITVQFNGIPSLIRIGGVLREFGIDNIQLITDSPPIINQPPETTAPPPFTTDANTGIQVTGLSGTDSDGTVTQFIITSLPLTEQGTLFFGNPAADGSTATLNQIIPANLIDNLFFQPSGNFTGTSFTYAAIDNQNAQDLSPETVTINLRSVTPGIPNAVDDTISGPFTFSGTNNSDNFDALTFPINIAFSELQNNDIPSSGLTIVNLSSAVNGTVPITISNPIVFTPSRGFPPGSFQYTVTNTSSQQDIATVSIPTVTYNANGNAGNDSLAGGLGNDTINGNTGYDIISGRGGNDRLLGGAGNDLLEGGSGNDTLIGGLGNDTLVGGLGVDTFQYNSPSEGFDSSTERSDTITDFLRDIIAVSAFRFGGSLTVGTLSSSQFSTSLANLTQNTRFIYDQGALYYDGDGSGSNFSPITIANFSNNPGLTFTDIVVF